MPPILPRPIWSVIRRPVGAATKLVNWPTAIGRYGPRGAVELLKGGSLARALEGRIVLITGGSSGIGAATAVRIGAAGGEVVLVARGAEKLDQTAAAVEKAGGRAHVYPCDLSDVSAIETMAESLLDEIGRVDILVNSAGRSIRRSMELSYDRFHDFERTIQLNYLAAVRLILLLVPGMRERGFGHVLNVSSAGVQTRVPRFGPYIASKAALDTVCDAFQAETSVDDVRFTTVHMPLVRTPMIAPTELYDNFPALSPEEAADVLCRAIVSRPRRISPPFAMLAAAADAVSPQVMDRVRTLGFRLFDD